MIEKFAFMNGRVARSCTVLGVACLALSVAADAAPKELSDEEVAAAVKAIIAERSRDGVFGLLDARTGDQLSLVLEDVRVVRGLSGFGWFPNVDFHEQANPARKYTLDFWLKPDAERLALQGVRIHKAPKRDGDGWMSVTRPPLAWWWLPTLKRQSAVGSIPAWEVMGTIHAHIAGGPQEPELALVDIEQPVGRSKTDGRYFACALLRKFGSEPLFYSTTYWLDAKTKVVTAGSTMRLGAGSVGTGKAATEPRCDVGGAAFDIID